MKFVHVDDVPLPERRFGGHVHVYALVDPRDSGVRYVGITRKAIEDRLDEHIENPTNRRTRAWFAELSAVGSEPEAVCLQSVSRGWEVAEMEWIAWFRARGDLLNVDDGGRLFEEGTGWDDIKRAKADLFMATAQAYANEMRPPPCACDNRTLGDKRAENRRIKNAMALGERRAAARHEKFRERELAASQEAARAATSIEPTIYRKGTGKPREDRGRNAQITPRDALGGAREGQ